MIRNLTKAEWHILDRAIDYFWTVIDETDDPYAAVRKNTLNRAGAKAMQLAGDGISTLTNAEWDALVGAVALQQTIWEQDGNDAGQSAARKIANLERAFTKARQLAPDRDRARRNAR